VNLPEEKIVNTNIKEVNSVSKDISNKRKDKI